MNDATPHETWCGYYDREEYRFDPAGFVVGTWDEARTAVRSYLTKVLLDHRNDCPHCAQAGADRIAQLDALTPGSEFTAEGDGWVFVVTADVPTVGEIRR